MWTGPVSCEAGRGASVFSSERRGPCPPRGLGWGLTGTRKALSSAPAPPRPSAPLCPPLFPKPMSAFIIFGILTREIYCHLLCPYSSYHHTHTQHTTCTPPQTHPTLYTPPDPHKHITHIHKHLLTNTPHILHTTPHKHSTYSTHPHTLHTNYLHTPHTLHPLTQTLNILHTHVHTTHHTTYPPTTHTTHTPHTNTPHTTHTQTTHTNTLYLTDTHRGLVQANAACLNHTFHLAWSSSSPDPRSHILEAA